MHLRHAFWGGNNRGGRRVGRVRPTVEALERRDLPTFSITNLGTYNGLPLTPAGINDQGQVAGFVAPADPMTPGPFTAFLYTPGKGMTTLQSDDANARSVQARAINDAGQIVGSNIGGDSKVHAILWNNNGTSPTTLSGDPSSMAMDINAGGEIVGSSTFTGGTTPSTDAADWAGGASDPVDLGPGVAMGVNAAGDVVGAVTGTQPGMSQPVVVPGGGDTGDVLLLPAGDTLGTATDINKEGNVVGWGEQEGTLIPDGFLWKFNPQTHAYTRTFLGHFLPFAINDNDIVVGYSGGTGTGLPATAVFWEASLGEVSLQKLVPAPLGWTLQTAIDINDHDVITGRGTVKGQQVGYVLKAVPPNADLNVQLDDDHLVPVRATDLHLSQLYGGEQVRVPVVVVNNGPDDAEGTVQIALAFDLTPGVRNVTPWTTRVEEINLAPGEKVTFVYTLTVPKTLAAGEHYIVAAHLQSSDIGTEPDEDTSDTKYEFVGTAAAGFSSSGYFQMVRDTLHGKAVPGVNRTDLQGFVGHWLGDSPWPYKNAQGVPMISVGIDLATVSGRTKTDLAAAVRAYYLAKDGQHLGNDDAVIALLIGQALPVDPRHPGRHAPQAITTSDDHKLFADASAARVALATQETGSVWSSLTGREKIALIDAVYRQGRLPLAVSAGLEAAGGPDFVRAGFALANAAGTTAGLRVEAEYQELLSASVKQLG